MNGVVEVANKNIKKIVQKMMMTYKDWHDMLLYALHGHRLQYELPRGNPLFIGAVLLVEVKIPSLRVLAEARLDDDEWVQSRLDQLNLIEEKWLMAICHGQL
ncbi:hypothetical protein CR513_09347, partial [Mucuna pruriens]